MGFCNANKYWWPLVWEIHFLLCNLERDQFAENHPRENTHYKAKKENGKFRAAAAQVCEVQLIVVNMNMTWCFRRGRSRSRIGQALLQRDSNESEETQVIVITITISARSMIIHNIENLQHHLDHLAQTLLERMQMELERVQVMTRDSINSIVENSFGGNRWLALMVTSRILVLVNPWSSLKAVIGVLVAFTAAVAVTIYYLCFESEEQVINIKNADDHHHHHDNP